MLKEIIVVEGKMDTLAVKRALDADTLETGGFSLTPYTLSKIAAAYQKRGIIILTDPDRAGERIRSFLSKRFPDAGHAFVPKEEALSADDLGIEQASPESIRTALSKVRHQETERREEFTQQDMFVYGLSGAVSSARKRTGVGAVLGIGYANAKTFLYRLNNYGVSREEFFKALETAEE